MRIHPEGYFTIVTNFIVLTAINVLLFSLNTDGFVRYLVLVVSGILFIGLLFFFRHPKRQVLQDERVVLAPADGKVVAIEEVEESEYFKDKRIQVSLFMSPFNVHVNRCPIGGRVKYLKYHSGNYRVAWHPKSSMENERCTVVISNQRGEILFRQIAGILARRIVNYLKEGDVVTQGSPMGIIKFGSRIDVFLPLNMNILVKLGQSTKGGLTKIGTF